MINRRNFIEPLEKIHPKSRQYKPYWKEVKRKCIDGVWIGGVWMPGALYFYGNVWQINLMADQFSKSRTIGHPRLRDLEWSKFYYYYEARGFSGFEEDEKITCLEIVKGLTEEDPKYLKIKESYPNGFTKEGKPKEYEAARTYICRIHSKSKGRPLFENYAKNFMEIGSRRLGKTESLAAVTGYNFLFDGYTDYKLYEEHRLSGAFSLSETLIGAIDTKYSKKVISSLNFGIDNLPGGGKFNSINYTAPLYKQYSGSIRESNGELVAVREVKENGVWVKKGTRSKIYHRTFGDNAFAGNGTGSTLIAIDEVGFMHNLTDVLGALKDSTMDMAGGKFGTIWLSGTSGDMIGGASLGAQEVFYNPEEYDMITFDDEWESRGKICCFLSATHSLEEYKDEDGYTNVEEATKYWEKEREKAKNAKSPSVLNNLLQYRPLKPSEAFLVIDGNQFPVADLKNWLSELLATPELIEANWYVDFTLDSKGNVLENPSSKKPILHFPYKNKNGVNAPCIIYKKPYKENGEIPSGRYIAGTDTVDDDKDNLTEDHSLQSTLILDLYTDEIVAEYTARPRLVKDYYEQLRRLLIHYNAKTMYERNKPGLYGHFSNKHSKYLLANTPEKLKGIDKINSSSGNQSKGIAINDHIKGYGIDLIQEFLEKQIVKEENKVLNLCNIYSVPFLEELIMYNKDINCDRISAFIMLVIHRELMYTAIEESREKKKKTSDTFAFFKDRYNKGINKPINTQMLNTFR